MSMRFINPKSPVFSATVSGTSPVNSSPFSLGAMSSACASWIISVGSGLTATFKIMVSADGVTYYDSGQVLPAVSGSASTFPAEYSGAFPWVQVQVIPSAGSGLVTILGSAKGGA